MYIYYSTHIIEKNVVANITDSVKGYYFLWMLTNLYNLVAIFIHNNTYAIRNSKAPSNSYTIYILIT